MQYPNFTPQELNSDCSRNADVEQSKSACTVFVTDITSNLYRNHPMVLRNLDYMINKLRIKVPKRLKNKNIVFLFSGLKELLIMYANR